MAVNSRTIRRLLQGHGTFIREAESARRYFVNHNRIKDDNSVVQRQTEAEAALGNPLRLADNRISHNWHTYYQTVYAISQQAAVRTSFARMDTDTVEKLLVRPWLDSDFSSRFWADKDKLLRELETALSRSFVRGDPLQRTTKQFAERMGVSESRAATLIHTESAHAAAEATAKGYKETGVSEYQFDASLDLKTCAVCGALDGKTFPVSVRETGVSYPPIHPRCRCTTVPVTEFDAGGQRAARNPETGKTEYVDQGMTYEDWYEKYVAGESVEKSPESAIMGAKSEKNGETAVQPVGVIDIEKYRGLTDHIRGDQVVLRQHRTKK